MLAWTAAWVAAGLPVPAGREAGRPGARVEQAGSDFAGDVAEIQQKVGRLPVVGDELRTRSDAWPGSGGPWPTPG